MKEDIESLAECHDDAPSFLGRLDGRLVALFRDPDLAAEFAMLDPSILRSAYCASEWRGDHKEPDEVSDASENEFGTILCSELGEDGLPCLERFSTQFAFLSHIRKTRHARQTQHDVCHQSVSVLYVDFCIQTMCCRSFKESLGSKRHWNMQIR